jgi:hypothetical protein
MSLQEGSILSPGGVSPSQTPMGVPDTQKTAYDDLKKTIEDNCALILLGLVIVLIFLMLTASYISENFEGLNLASMLDKDEVEENTKYD